MSTQGEVENFLRDFHQKMKVFRIVFRNDRAKNTQALLDLDMPPGTREAIIEKLKVEHYSEGPLEDVLYQISELWVFGYPYKGIEIYIKITMGYKNSPVICISFHPADHPMVLPYKRG